MSVRSYDEAEAFVGRRDSKVISNNTRVMRYPDGYAVRLHKTDVVTFHPDERITLAAGGWYTDTTMRRIEEFSPFSVWREDGRWYVWAYREEYSRAEPFAEGLTFSRVNGRWLPTENRLEQAALRLQEMHNRRVNALIARYLAFLRTAPRAGAPPGAPIQNCVLCVLHPGTGQLTGDVIGDYQHLIEHLMDRVYVPQMLVAASLEAGYNGAFYQPRAVRRFLQQRLLLGAVGGRTGRRPHGEVAWNLTRRAALVERRERKREVA